MNTKDRIKGWNNFFSRLDYPLSYSMKSIIKEYQHMINGNIIEIACGMHPLSDHIDITNKKRVLVDIINLEKKLEPMEDNPILVCADLYLYNNFKEQNHPYNVALENIGGSYDSLIIGSGINYFPWEDAFNVLLEDMNPSGLVFLHTGIFSNKDLRSPLLDSLIDDDKRPKSCDYIRNYFEKLHYDIIEDYRYYNLASIHHIDIVARKK